MVAASLERVYTIPLRVRSTHRLGKAARASHIIREYLVKHTKTETEDIKIGSALNELVWKRGAKHPPSRVRVQIKKIEGIVYAELEGVEIKLPAKEEKKTVKKETKEEHKHEEIAAQKTEEEKKQDAEKAVLSQATKQTSREAKSTETHNKVQ